MMFPFRWGWDWDWGWGLASVIGSIVLLVILVIPWFFFLLNLQNLLLRVQPRNRAMPSGYVWLNFIPVFNLGWFLYTVMKVRDSVRAEYVSRGWAPEGDQGYNVGLVTGVLAIASFFLGWVPGIGWAIAIAQLICWILYWLKTHELVKRLSTTRDVHLRSTRHIQWPQAGRAGRTRRAGRRLLRRPPAVSAAARVTAIQAGAFSDLASACSKACAGAGASCRAAGSRATAYGRRAPARRASAG